VWTTGKLYQYDLRFTLEGKEDEDLFAPRRFLDLRKKMFEELLKRGRRDIFGNTVGSWHGLVLSCLAPQSFACNMCSTDVMMA